MPEASESERYVDRPGISLLLIARMAVGFAAVIAIPIGFEDTDWHPVGLTLVLLGSLVAVFFGSLLLLSNRYLSYEIRAYPGFSTRGFNLLEVVDRFGSRVQISPGDVSAFDLELTRRVAVAREAPE